MAMYKKFDLSPEIVAESLNILESASKSGKIRKGTNEVTKSIERQNAQMVYIAEDVSPPEIVMHLPLLCEEKKIPYTYVATRDELGKSANLSVGASSVAIVDAGEAKNALEGLTKKVNELKK